jgi:UDP-N-acetylglucosamine 2-epimerase (non-hydrolysing)
VLTDSGTIIEETSILGIPSVQMRKSTERPQVYNFGSAIKFDPFGRRDINEVINDLRSLKAKSWKHKFGDGKASYRIVDDLVDRYSKNNFNGHQPSKREPFSLESYKD